jgi:hypothetical protein
MSVKIVCAKFFISCFRSKCGISEIKTRQSFLFHVAENYIENPKMSQGKTTIASER